MNAKSFVPALCAFALPLLVHATTYYVAPTGSDDANGTSDTTPLKSISVALAKADVTEIQVAAGEYSDMTPMTSSLSKANAIDWLGVVSAGVKIVGAGSANTILNCVSVNNTDRGGILLNHLDAELSGVTIKGAYHSGNDIAGVAVRIDSGTMRNCVLTENGTIPSKDRCWPILTLGSASAFAYDSSIIDNDRGTGSQNAPVVVTGGTIVRCRIANNKSGDYALANGLVLTGAKAEDCVIEGNTGYNTGISAGGVNMSGISKLLGCIVTNNLNTSPFQNGPSTYSAGGVYVSGAKSVISNCTIAGNANYSSCGLNAGGLYLGAANVTIIDTAIADNFSANGPELLLNGNSLVTNSVISNVRGAPLVTQNSGRVLGCTLDDGSSLVDTRPAVCYVSTEGSATAPYDTAEKATPDLQAAVGAVRRGGRVVVAPGSYENTSPIVARKANIRHTVLVDKDVSIEGPADPSLAHFIVENKSTVKTYGGGFWIAHPNARLSGVTISVTARPGDSFYYGGQGLQVDSGIVSNCVVTGCSEISSVGTHTMPPVAIDGGKMTHSWVRDNRHISNYWGRGAAGLVMSAGSFEHGYVLRNGFPTANADQALANGVYMRGGTVTDTIVEGNYGGANRDNVGSGVSMESGTMERCIIQCNTNNAGNAGSKSHHAGGVLLNGAARLVNCLIADNRALTTSASSAGGLYVKNSTAVVRHVTLTGNTSAAGAGGAYLASGENMLASVAFANNGSQVVCGSGAAGAWTSGINFRDTSVPFPVAWTNADAYAITSASAGYNSVTENYAETDMLGVARPEVTAGSTDFPDAGAMEKVGPKPGEVAASVTPSSALIPSGGSAEFVVTLDGDDTTVARCEWTITLGGSSTTTNVYSDTFVFRPSEVGSYTLTVKAVNSSSKTAPDKSVAVTVSPFVCFVSQDGDDIYPYDTAQKAARTIGQAISAVYSAAGLPGTVKVLPGTYTGMAEMTAANNLTYVGVLDKPVKIIAVDGPSATTIRYTSTDLGGCFIVSDADAVLSGFTITGSVKTDNDSRWTGYGNAVTLTSGTVSNCVITGCSVTGTHIVPLMLMAGGLAADVAITNNGAIGTVWGRGPLGVYMTGGTLTNSVVSGCNMTAKNHDQLRAGGIYLKNGRVTGCRIENNTMAYPTTVGSPEISGGVLVEGGILENTLIAGNRNMSTTSNSGSAGGLLLNSSSAVVDHVTVADNTCLTAASSYRGAIVKAGTLKNSIFWGNDASDLGSTGGTITYSCWPSAAGTGNISQNPDLRTRHKIPCCINMASPCAHSGENGSFMGWLAPYPGGLVLSIK